MPKPCTTDAPAAFSDAYSTLFTAAFLSLVLKLLLLSCARFSHRTGSLAQANSGCNYLGEGAAII